MAQARAVERVGRRSGLARLIADQRRWMPYLFVAPFFITFFVFTAYPMLRAVVMAFQEMTGFTGEFEWVGLENFREVLSNDRYVGFALYNMAYYTVGSLATQLPAAFLLALLLTGRSLWGRGFFRTLFFIPAVLPGVTMGVIGLWLFNTSRGFVNQLWLGVGGQERISWTMLPQAILPMLLTIAFWQWMGNHAVYLIAGMSGMEPSILEAAVVDGASGWQRARYIILPLLRPVFAYISITAAAGSLVVFELPYLMITNGGPGGKGWFFIPYIAYMAFDQFRMGYATAIGWVVFVLAIVLTIIQLKVFGFGEAS
jgi:ABC-type sugar transport system permease subunit